MKTTLILSILMLFYLCSCENPKSEKYISAVDATGKIKIDTAAANEVARKKEAEKYYAFETDTVRQEWVASHPYMCYKSNSYMGETVGFDKEGKRVTNQILGIKEANNAFCFNREKRLVTWDHYENGNTRHTEYRINNMKEFSDATGFETKDKQMGKYVFMVPDDGRRIYILYEHVTLTFMIDE